MNGYKILMAAVSAALAFQPGWSLAQAATEADNWERHMSQMMWGGGWWGMIFGPLFMIFTLGAVIAVIILLVRGIGGPWYGAQPPYQQPPGRALDILNERFARGEIDKEEYEERRRVIEQ